MFVQWRAGGRRVAEASPTGAADRPAAGSEDCEAKVPVERLAELQARVARISRRYERAGSSPVTLLDTGRRAGDLVVVRLDGQTPSLGDWRIVCVLHHEPCGTRVEPCEPISDAQRDRLASSRALCEACRTMRPRTKTFLLRERATGRTVQLGSSCLRPYTGADSPEAAIARAEALAGAADVVRVAATPTKRPSGGARYIDTSVFVAHAVAVVRACGYVPARSAGPTWSAALERLERGHTVIDADLVRAREIREWAATRRTDEPQSYPSRRAACLQHERLTSRELALAASAVPAYNRRLYWMIRRRARRTKKDTQAARRRARQGDARANRDTRC